MLDTVLLLKFTKAEPSGPMDALWTESNAFSATFVIVLLAKLTPSNDAGKPVKYFSPIVVRKLFSK